MKSHYICEVGHQFFIYLYIAFPFPYYNPTFALSFFLTLFIFFYSLFLSLQFVLHFTITIKISNIQKNYMQLVYIMGLAGVVEEKKSSNASLQSGRHTQIGVENAAGCCIPKAPFLMIQRYSPELLQSTWKQIQNPFCLCSPYLTSLPLSFFLFLKQFKVLH